MFAKLSSFVKDRQSANSKRLRETNTGSKKHESYRTKIIQNLCRKLKKKFLGLHKR